MMGARGEIYVVIQGALFALVLFGPKSIAAIPAWPVGATVFFSGLGLLLIMAGLIVSVLAAWNLGRSLTPLPYPKADAALVTTGLFRYVRHPIYCGVIFLALGWSIYTQGTLTLCYAFVLAVFLDIKSRQEEIWLCQKFADYPQYQKTTRKLIPGIY
ncbi:MAG: isoprenylcysteine carboxylmethyltransferase family protein [Burkholderiaceae bacterium]|nr:isoprenylcysteine carboxylmethyltransferase family protein [Burkholderiaceae bacterium]